MINNRILGFVLMGAFLGYIINQQEGAFMGAVIGLAISFVK